MSAHSIDHADTREHGGRSRPYLWFWVTMVLSFAIMYIVMFSMIDGWGDFRNNANMFYMTLTMWAPMGIFMLIFMRGMYKKKILNIALLVIFALVTVGSFAATRTQLLVDDRQFVDSMIPHHSGAILMCREASLTDPELIALCQDIIGAQREEILKMEKIRERLD
ncbi:DUF305 domain-containing protein [Microbacterium sp. NPDC078814]|uniref:DUF305 domain-containing protein n=1 Tax=Microbacterium sp. NPDC078814 TaxID=3154767 RepID=UPI003450368F